MGRLRDVLERGVDERGHDRELLVGAEGQARVDREIQHRLSLPEQERVAKLHLGREDSDQPLPRRPLLQLGEERPEEERTGRGLGNVPLLRVEQVAVGVREVQRDPHRLDDGGRRRTGRR
jgi:hypothetical protein